MSPLTFGTVCSGIGAPEFAWAQLGWICRWCCEIADFPSRVLATRFPGVPNHHDLEALARGEVELEPVDVLIGGTPCQSFSVAGLGRGLDDPRGQLALAFLQVARRARARWVVWENVPGVLSKNGGRDFGSILGGLGELGFRFAYRVLDAQFFGVPQRRRRVFVVGHLGDVPAAEAVLFERQSLLRNPPPSRASREGAAAGAARRARAGVPDVAGPLGSTTAGGGLRTTDLEGSGAFIPEVAPTVTSKWAKGTGGPAGDEAQNLVPVPHSVLAGIDQEAAFRRFEADVRRGLEVLAFDETQVTHPENRSNPQPGDPSPTLSKAARPATIAFSAKDHGADAAEELSPTLRAGGFTTSHANGGVMPAVAFSIVPEGGQGADLRASEVEVAPALTTEEAKSIDRGTRVVSAMRVRRLTPRECERLQGFPDDWTLVEGASDSARYMALGNSMATVVIRWLGERIDAVERLLRRAA